MTAHLSRLGRVAAVTAFAILLLHGGASAETSYHKLKKRLRKLEKETGSVLKGAGAVLGATVEIMLTPAEEEDDGTRYPDPIFGNSPAPAKPCHEDIAIPLRDAGPVKPAATPPAKTQPTPASAPAKAESRKKVSALFGPASTSAI